MTTCPAAMRFAARYAGGSLVPRPEPALLFGGRESKTTGDAAPVGTPFVGVYSYRNVDGSPKGRASAGSLGVRVLPWLSLNGEVTYDELDPRY